MIENVTLCTITMNAGRGIVGSTLPWALREIYAEFKRVIVVDGDLTESAKEFYKTFPNVQVIDSPWRDGQEDCYVTQYRAFYEALSDEEWCLYLDCDEVPSEALLEFLRRHKFDRETVDIIKLPCVLHLTDDGKNYYAAENHPDSVFANQWTKNILFEKCKYVQFRHFGSHVIPESSRNKYLYAPFAYYHMKSLESFVYNDVWQAFLSPEGQQYTREQVVKFKMFTQCYKTTKEFKNATKKGTWSPPLKKFAWDNRHVYNSPISRLAWVYWILEGHLMPENDPTMTWENVSSHVLSGETLAIFDKNKKCSNLIEVSNG
jgi:glycosyltransferase involved in cell wall biosynthesis